MAIFYRFSHSRYSLLCIIYFVWQLYNLLHFYCFFFFLDESAQNRRIVLYLDISKHYLYTLHAIATLLLPSINPLI